VAVARTDARRRSMGVRKSMGKNKKSSRPAAALATKREEVMRKSVRGTKAR
jgi:hypothetical protein